MTLRNNIKFGSAQQQHRPTVYIPRHALTASFLSALNRKIVNLDEVAVGHNKRKLIQRAVFNELCNVRSGGLRFSVALPLPCMPLFPLTFPADLFR